MYAPADGRRGRLCPEPNLKPLSSERRFESARRRFADATQDSTPVRGYTHDFYRYPARFSPTFVRAAIALFTKPGDVVLDPFMGGGTTLVEARILGRPSVGLDVSPLATLIAKVKTTTLSEADRSRLDSWVAEIQPRLSLRSALRKSTAVDVDDRLANLGGQRAWPLRKLLSLAVESVQELPTNRERLFARCALLKTAQWALDGRRQIPGVEAFRRRLIANVGSMLDGAREFEEAAHEARRAHAAPVPLRAWCYTASASELSKMEIVRRLPAPRLILTSPPYPGVHVLYHRWQVAGRRETPLPFWIASVPDGNGPSFYTFAHRSNTDAYFRRALDAFSQLAVVADRRTIMIQLLGFADPPSQLPAYLSMLRQAGWTETSVPFGRQAPGARLWRVVPNRRWHAKQKGSTAASREVLLIHRVT